MLLGLVHILPIILFFSSHLTSPRTLPKMPAQLLSKMDFNVETYGYMSTLIIGWGPLPFWPPRSLPAHVQTGKSSWISGVGTLSLHFSRTQLLPLALSLKCLGGNKGLVLLHSTNTRCPSQAHIYLLPQNDEVTFYSYLQSSLMLLNCGVGEDSWESLRLQGDPASPS